MVRIVNGEVCPVDGPHRRSQSAASAMMAGSGGGASSASGHMPPLTLEPSALQRAAREPTSTSNASSLAGSRIPSRATSPALGPSAAPTQVPLSAQHTNPYLSHTTYGGSSLTSGHSFSPSEDTAEAQAQALAAAYYPYHHLQGFLGPGFILGSQAAGQDSFPQNSSTVSPSLPVLPVSGPSSSCPSPLLTSTIERRRSKPHLQFIPSTHSVTASGLVVPVRPPIVATGRKGSVRRVPHAFNLFNLPPIYIYDCRIPPHVYLLTGLFLYALGPPALIPLVVIFFFWRWQMQKAGGSSGGGASSDGTAGGAHASHSKEMAASHPLADATSPPPPRHPPAISKAHPSPLVTLRRNPNIHSLYDT